MGVSTATVSRVLNDKPGVREVLRSKVLSAVRVMGYVPRSAARHLSRDRTDTLGVALQDLTPGWCLTIFNGVRASTGAAYHLLTAFSTKPGDELELPRQLLAGRRVDGLIWLDMRVTSSMVREVKKQPVPFVLLQHQLPDPDVNTIAVDSKQGAREVVLHLLRTGYRRILMITGPSRDEESERKLSGAHSALQEYGVEVPQEDILEGHHVAHHAVRALSAYLDAGHRLPEAIFAFNDGMALSVLNLLRGRGVKVPGDVALVGYDGIEEARQAGLTTVETPLYDMGVLAGQMLMDLIDKPVADRKARQVLLGGTLRIRETCGASLRAAAPQPSTPRESAP